MANPYSKYTGTRIQPVPAGYLTAAGQIGESTRKGWAGLGKSIGEGIASYYEKKEEDEQEDIIKGFWEQSVGEPDAAPPEGTVPPEGAAPTALPEVPKGAWNPLPTLKGESAPLEIEGSPPVDWLKPEAAGEGSTPPPTGGIPTGVAPKGKAEPPQQERKDFYKTAMTYLGGAGANANPASQERIIEIATLMQTHQDKQREAQRLSRLTDAQIRSLDRKPPAPDVRTSKQKEWETISAKLINEGEAGSDIMDAHERHFGYGPEDGQASGMRYAIEQLEADKKAGVYDGREKAYLAAREKILGGHIPADKLTDYQLKLAELKKDYTAGDITKEEYLAAKLQMGGGLVAKDKPSAFAEKLAVLDRKRDAGVEGFTGPAYTRGVSNLIFGLDVAPEKKTALQISLDAIGELDEKGELTRKEYKRLKVFAITRLDIDPPVDKDPKQWQKEELDKLLADKSIPQLLHTRLVAHLASGVDIDEKKTADEVRVELVDEIMVGQPPENITDAKLRVLNALKESPNKPTQIAIYEFMLDKGLLGKNPEEIAKNTKRHFGINDTAFIEKMEWLKAHKPDSIDDEQLYRANAGITLTALENKTALLDSTKAHLPKGWTGEDAYRVVMLGKDISHQTTVNAFASALNLAKGDEVKTAAVYSNFGVPTAQQVELEKESLLLKKEQVKIAEQTFKDMEKKASTKDFWEQVKDGKHPFIDIEGVGRYVFTSTGGGYLEKDASTAGGSGSSSGISIIATRWKSLSQSYHTLRKGGVPEEGQWNLDTGVFKPGTLDPTKLDDSNKRQLTMMGHVLATMEQEMNQTPYEYYDYTKMRYQVGADTVKGKWVSIAGGPLPVIIPKKPVPLGGVPPVGGNQNQGQGVPLILPRPRNPLTPPKKR